MGRLLAAVVLMGFAACSTTHMPEPEFRLDSAPQTLHAGDVIKISFPGTPTLDQTQPIRRDGGINLYLIGEVKAEGKTPAELQQELVQRYAPQLVSKEVNVSVVSSAFSVLVGGAVVRPGKIQPDHALTVLEAIMEAGGFVAEKANTKEVVVLRQENGKTKRYTLNLKAVLDGTETESFYLRSYDIVYVREKFQWF